MTFLPECLDDWVGDDNPVHVIEAFVEALELGGLGSDGIAPKATGRPSYHRLIRRLTSVRPKTPSLAAGKPGDAVLVSTADCEKLPGPSSKTDIARGRPDHPIQQAMSKAT